MTVDHAIGGSVPDWLMKIAGPEALKASVKIFVDGLRNERLGELNKEFRESESYGLQSKEFDQKIQDLRVYQKAHKVESAVAAELFGLQKQGESGNCTLDKPWFFQSAKKAQYQAWMSNKNVTMKDSQTQFIALANKVMGVSA